MADDDDAGSHPLTHKTKAPNKVWTSRSWWQEIPTQNEVKLIREVVS